MFLALRHFNQCPSSFVCLIIRRKNFLYDRGDYNLYRQKLSTIDWDSMFTGHDIDSITYSIRQTITDIASLRRIVFFSMAIVNQGGLSFLIEIIILGIMSLAMSVIVCLILYVMESIS
jgi:hypothetical protein